MKEVLEKGVGPPRRNGERVFVSEEEIQEMQAAGISFGSHTKSHPILTWLDSKSLLEELHDSKNAIEKVTGSNRMWFSYPDGMFSDKEERAVQEVGYIGAVQTFRNPERSSMFAVPRVGLSVVSTTGFKGRFSRAKMEVTLAGINRKRIKMLRKSFRF